MHSLSAVYISGLTDQPVIQSSQEHQAINCIKPEQASVLLQLFSKFTNERTGGSAKSYYSCLAFPAAFTQPGDQLLAEPCNEVLNCVICVAAKWEEEKKACSSYFQYALGKINI